MTIAEFFGNLGQVYVEDILLGIAIGTVVGVAIALFRADWS
jgi:gas vesicle protein